MGQISQKLPVIILVDRYDTNDFFIARVAKLVDAPL